MKGMSEVWVRYGAVSKSFDIKYGGMAYREEGAGVLARAGDRPE
jgi:hypothetical protein